MIETVRLVSDGEEIVSFQGEAIRLHLAADPREPALDRRGESTAPSKDSRGTHA
jgi:hypothetical protein